MNTVAEQQVLTTLSPTTWMTLDEILQSAQVDKSPETTHSLNLVLNKLILDWEVVAEKCPKSKWKFKLDS